MLYITICDFMVCTRVQELIHQQTSRANIALCRRAKPAERSHTYRASGPWLAIGDTCGSDHGHGRGATLLYKIVEGEGVGPSLGYGESNGFIIDGQDCHRMADADSEHQAGDRPQCAEVARYTNVCIIRSVKNRMSICRIQ